MAEEKKHEFITGLEIAIIGMAGRFPGANSIDEFWDNLKNGVESIVYFLDGELMEANVDPELIKNPGYVKARGLIDDSFVDYFDAFFFDYIPKDAEVLDPQTRIFHECAWEALENAGYDPGTYPGLIGIYAGASNHLNWEAYTLLVQWKNNRDMFSTSLLNDKDYLVSRVSYKLNLKGPAVAVETACSTSLVAIHLACRALLTGECDMALAGGVTVRLPRKRGYTYQQGMIKSPDGHCRAFDAAANGTVGGEGCGIIVLKKLKKAIEDGDEIYALIKGSAINNDGCRKVGYTAPSVEGQVAVIQAAFHMAEVELESITYIETHGTGTPLGDPVEVEALIQSFKTDKKRFCRLGSVKTNVGHLDNAAGVAGVIKTALALKYKQIPPSLHFNTPNPKIDFKNSPFFVNTRLTSWESEKYPLRAGVSSFGIGGTNAHVVLEEAPKPESSSKSRSHQLFLLSAATRNALEKLQKKLGGYLQENPGVNLADAAYTLQVGRGTLKHRMMWVCTTNELAEIIEALLSPDSGKIRTALIKQENRPVVFLFPGQGSQYVNMGLALYREEAFFRQEMDHCFEILRPLMGYDIKEILYPSLTAGRSEISGMSDINQTTVTQPLIFVFEYALARLLMKWGIKPYAMMGHSIGEYVAACLSGVFSLNDALTIVTLRGRLMQQMPEGDMISVTLPEDELKLLLPKELSLAAVNGPGLCVVSGPQEAIRTFEAEMQEKGNKTRLLHTSHAFHSWMMDPLLSEFADNISKINLNKPEIPYISNVTGKWITVEDATNPWYWARQVSATVRFSAGLELLLAETGSIFLEVGPGTTLSTFARQYLDKDPGHPVLNLVRHPQEKMSDLHCLLNVLGQLWLFGKTIDWQEFYSGEKRRRVPLPSYPYDYQHYPADVKILKSVMPRGPLQDDNKTDISEWFHIPLWMKYPLTDSLQGKIKHSFNWLLFIDEGGLGAKLVKRLEEKGQKVCMVKVGVEFKKFSEKEYTINPHQEKDYDSLMVELRKSAQIPHYILHLWGISPMVRPILLLEEMDGILDTGFYSLLHIAQALGREAISHDIKLKVITTNMQEVTGDETLFPEKATILGAVNVIPLEYPNLDCSSIDIVLPEPGSPSEERLMERLLRELSAEASQRLIAFRGNHRWVRIFKPLPFDHPVEAPQRLKEKGVYLISGGLGGIGLTISENLAKTVKARLILTGRSAFPPVEQWDDWLKTHDETDSVSIKIKKVRQLEAFGAEVLIIHANVSDLEKMQQEIDYAEKRFGPVNGVIHSAGVADGAIIQARNHRMSEQVFESKVWGTLVLEQIFECKKLDFFVLCSSLNSIIPTFGQAAYCAANAYLDAFAQYQNSLTESCFTTAINWDVWREVGMAVEAAKRLEERYEDMQAKEIAHPLFNKYMHKDSFDIYISHLSVKNNWVLEEHRIMGKATLPGTTYLEMARAAFDHSLKEEGTVEIREVYFLIPLVVEEEEEIEVHTLLKKQEQHEKGFEFFIISRQKGGKAEWREHATGYICRIPKELPPQYEIEKIESICNLPPQVFERPEKDREEQESPLKFGPRWNCYQEIKLGVDQGLKKLELPRDFAGDLEFHKLHPALLDCALAGVFGRGSYFLPFSYKNMKIFGALQTRVASYIKYLDNDKSPDEFKNYQITIMDEKGNALIYIERYTLKKVPIDRIQSRDIDRNQSTPAFISNEITNGFPIQGKDIETSSKRTSLKHGLLPSQGVEVFNRILASSQSNVAISLVDFDERLREAAKRNRLDSAGNLDLQEFSSSNSYARPELSTKYIKPGNETEEKISKVFQKILGIEKIGVNDNFFELGANSLLMVQVNRELQKELKKDISITNIYAYPTVKLLSDLLSKVGTAVEGEGFSKEEVLYLQEKTQKGIDKLKQRKERRKRLTNE